MVQVGINLGQVPLDFRRALVDVQIFHDSVKHAYRVVSVDGVNILINTLITARISFTKTSQKFCQWIDTKANHVYGLGFANESDLKRVGTEKKRFTGKDDLRSLI
jgi:hypothetical protein